VVGFLQSISCDEAVQNRFIEEKMTPEAIINADDNILKRHGLLADGDIIRLRVFCRSIDENARKVELRNTLNTSSSSQRQQESNKELKSKTVYFTWQNYDINSRKYCIVKSTKGGGPKKKKMPLKTTRGELLEMCKKMYWDKRVKKHFDDNSSFQLADHAGNVITNTLM
uniref:Uncharacterized protein n=1 Tax=Clytia hemisphaerica TaxID=252671 RepID=A0A7M5XET9_9CNID